MVPTEMSEYEQQRQANIAQRDKLLKQLALDAGQAGLGPKQASKPSSKSSSSHKKKAPVKTVKEDVGPRRTSSRLQGLTADSEVAKRKAEDEYVAVQEAARVKRQRNSGDINLSDVVVGGRDWDKSENFLVDVVSRGANPYERTFGETEVKETTDKELRSLREQMSRLELYDGFEPNRIKITPERIYSLGFHPSTDKPLVFAGDKMGNLGIFDASQKSSAATKRENGVKKEQEDEEDMEEDDPDPAITSFHCHTRTISSFQFSPANPSHLYTSSYDSSLRLLDLSKSKSTEIYAPLDSSNDEPLSGVEVDPTAPHMLYFSRLDGHVGRTDTRAPNTTDIFQLSEKKIGGFSLNPGNPHFVATASLDRYLRIWDLRKLSGKVGRQTPALIGEHESRLSVSHAAFNSAGQVATASYDDTVKIHTFEGMAGFNAGHKISDKEMAPSTIVRHNNQTGRWVTMQVFSCFFYPGA
ncbi:hypothetical protein MMC28_000943 [Mycoblastus sanguinarius]|nr:hypothetical protein [Mycoblastus sanguinarius]